jgi:hypothetical protein
LGGGERGLAAVMFTDIEGHTAQVQRDEARALQMLEEDGRIVRPFLPFESSLPGDQDDGRLVPRRVPERARSCEIRLRNHLE